MRPPLGVDQVGHDAQQRRLAAARRVRAASGSCRAGSIRSILSSAVTVPRSLVKRTLIFSQETAASANGAFADRIARDAGVPHDARLGHVEGRRLVQQAAIVPDDDVAGRASRGGRRAAPGRRSRSAPAAAAGSRSAVQARDVVGMAADQQRLAAGVGMRLDQRPQRHPRRRRSPASCSRSVALLRHVADPALAVMQRMVGREPLDPGRASPRRARRRRRACRPSRCGRRRSARPRR